MKNLYTVAGVMSGTSLDGLDIAICKFYYDKKWHFSIIDARTFDIPILIKNGIRAFGNLSLIEQMELDRDFGLFIGEKINLFAQKYHLDLIASHGHTTIHYPDKGLNWQIGKGAYIAAQTGIPVVYDFRSLDIALNGQGAPLVPGGEFILFDRFNAFLNLGGFANISVLKNSKIIAFDICPTNFALNYFARKLNSEYDIDGNFGKKGKINSYLLNELNILEYYKISGSKSLSDHWFYDTFLYVIKKYDHLQLFDILRTIYEHIALQIATTLNSLKIKQVMVTGGGAKNEFLLSLIKEKANSTIYLPEEIIIDFKEALIFAFLGLMTFLKKTNVYSSVTGSKADNIGGSVIFPFERK